MRHEQGVFVYVCTAGAEMFDAGIVQMKHLVLVPILLVGELLD
jgi:hypothetical protein